MASDANSSTNGWHSIRPWQPPLSLAVREVTSVSVTFILSSNLGNLNEDFESSLDLTEDGEPQAESSSRAEDSRGKSKSIIQEVLDRGMSVKVNGSPWQRVFIRIDDTADEAVIIIYSLMPGRHYDVDLELFQGDSSIRRQVVTEDAVIEPEPAEEATDPESPSFAHSSSDRQSSTPSTSPNRTNPNTPPTMTIQLSPEERLAQLQHTLTVLNTERDDLTASLKAARRDAQKSDASLRSEIEILKRASEKHMAAEHRAKQRMLSLQEAVKRTQNAATETEDSIKEVEDQLPEINRQKAAKEAEHAKVKAEADKVRKEKDRILEKEKKRIESMKAELSSLTNKVEKLNSKKEKLESTTLVDLEEQLREIGREIEQVDNEVYAEPQELFVEEYPLSIPQAIPENSPAFPYFPGQRMRSQGSPGTIGRPAPIQRPTPTDTQSPHWSVPSRQPQATGHNPRSTSLNSQGHITILQNPNRQSSLKASSSSGSTSGSHTSPTQPAKSNTSPSITLSSKAPAFEPGRPLKVVTGAGSGSSGGQAPIQRPNAGGARGSGFANHTKAKSSSHGAWDKSRNSHDESRN